MITDEQFQRIAALWPMLQSADAQIVREFRQHSFLARVPAGKTIFEPGDPVETVSLLLSGGVRILAGVALLALGLFGIQGMTRIIVAVIGVVPVLAGCSMSA